MRLRKRAAALTLGAVVLFLLGTNVQAGWLYVMCALLLGTVVAGAILPGRIGSGPGGRKAGCRSWGTHLKRAFACRVAARLDKKMINRF